MASDEFASYDADPTDAGGMQGMAVSVVLDDLDEANRVFGALADGGEVQMPMGETFSSPGFGMCADRFGSSWMVNVDAEVQA